MKREQPSNERKIFRSRAEKILSLVPEPFADSGEEESEKEELEDQLLFGEDIDKEVNDFLNLVHSLEVDNILQPLENETSTFLDESNKENEEVYFSIPFKNEKGEKNKKLSKREKKNRKVKKRRRIKRKHSQKEQKIHRQWQRKRSVIFEVSQDGQERIDMDGEKSISPPIDYFFKFFTREIFDFIIYQTNLYHVQVTGEPGTFNLNDIFNFFAIEIHMGICKLPSYEDYWAKYTRYPQVADLMPLKKYKNIRRFIHFNDNTVDNGDRWHKIRPVMDQLKENFQKINFENTFAIDEMMVPYKGRKAGKLKQYIKTKPCKWGFKFFVRSGQSGFTYDFLPYSGSSTFDLIKFNKIEKQFPMSSKVVIALSKSIPEKRLTKLYFDNFFTSLKLLQFLREEYGILALGTVRKDRIEGCPLLPDKELSCRGNFDQQVDEVNKIIVLKWMDRKSVLLASNFAGCDPISKIKRYSAEIRKKIEIDCPKLVKLYNQFMGGVDLSDMLVALYRIRLKSRKWYFNIFAQLLDITLNNSWILFKKYNQEEKTLKRFRLEVAEALTTLGNPRRGRPSNESRPICNNPERPNVPGDLIRFMNNEHLPYFGTKGRCRNCQSGQTTIWCGTCQIRLCFVPNRNCFSLFHTPD